MAILTAIVAFAASSPDAEAARPLFEIVPVPAQYQDAPPIAPPATTQQVPARQRIAPPVPPPPPFASPPRPRSPGSWVTSDDYPMIALRENMQGTVDFALSVAPDGRVSECRVERSSGWPALDSTTCALLRRRARFFAATDSTGTPIPTIFHSRFRWQMPIEGVSPMTSWARVTRFELDAKGLVLRCATRHFGTPVPVENDACAAASAAGNAAELRGSAAGPMTLDLVEIHAVDGAAMPVDFAMPAGTAVWAGEARLSIGLDGFVRGCERTGPERPGFLREYLAVCAPDWTYPIATEPGERRAVLRVSVVVEGR